MRVSLQIASIILVILALTPSLAHALELPAKRQLTQDVYVAVQTFYYRGFTLTGIAEPIAIIVAFLLLFVTPYDTTPFWSTLFALVCLLTTHAIYWRVIQPLNRIWVERERLAAGESGSNRTLADLTGDWQELRDRWERSHVARSIMSALALVALLIALSPIQTK